MLLSILTLCSSTTSTKVNALNFSSTRSAFGMQTTWTLFTKLNWAVYILEKSDAQMFFFTCSKLCAHVNVFTFCGFMTRVDAKQCWLTRLHPTQIISVFPLGAP